MVICQLLNRQITLKTLIFFIRLTIREIITICVEYDQCDQIGRLDFVQLFKAFGSN